MSKFKVFYTGDYLTERGGLAVPDMALDLYKIHPAIEYEFFRDQSPKPGEVDYWQRLYSLEVQSHHIAKANGIVIFRPWVKAAAFAEGAEHLVVIGRAGAGYDKIDIEACTANDVAVFNTPDTLTHSTASAAFLFILSLSKRLPEQQRLVRAHRWDLQPQAMGDDLPEKTLGIVGLGATGQELARLVRPWQMRVLAYSPHVEPDRPAELGVTLVPTLGQLFRESDFVSLHKRLEPRTRGMIGERELRFMKPTAFFINVARGELVQEQALIRALTERWFAGAGLDVFLEEPLPEDHPLQKLENVILTPHWLAATRRAARLTMKQISNGMIRVAQGLLPENIVNEAVLKRAGFQAKLSHLAI